MDCLTSCQQVTQIFNLRDIRRHLIYFLGYTRVASSDRLCCAATHNKGTPKIATTLCYAQETKREEVKDRRDILKIYDELKGKADAFGHLFKAQFSGGHHMNWQTSILCGWFYFSLTNAFYLYSSHNSELNHKEFIYNVACELMGL